MTAPGLKTSGLLSDTCIADVESSSRATAVKVTTHPLDDFAHVLMLNVAAANTK